MPNLQKLTSDGSYSIRRATSADIAEIVALLRDDPLGKQRESSNWSVYHAAFEEITQDPNQFLAVVVNDQAAIVGTMQLTLIPGLSRGGTKRLQIEGVRIAASVRGAGLGSAMLQWGHQYGRDHGASLVQLTSDKTRPDALRFYTSHGYVPSHEGFKLSL